MSKVDPSAYIIEASTPKVLVNKDTNYYLVSFSINRVGGGNMFITTDNLHNAKIFWSNESINTALTDLQKAGIKVFKKHNFSTCTESIDEQDSEY